MHRAGFKRSLFLPHAVEREQCEKRVECEKEYDVVFLGSCYDHLSLREAWQRELPKEACTLLEDAVACALENPYIHFTEALVKACQDSSVAFREFDFEKLCVYLDHYLRGKDRYELLHALEGVSVHIFGHLFWDEEGRLRDWEDYLGHQKNVTVHPGVPYEEVYAILRKSKVCLNSTPFFRNGTHERVFASLACECAVLSSANRYLEEEFGYEEGIAFYRSNHWEEANEKIHFLMDHASEVLKGKERVKHHHTWNQRAQTILHSLLYP